MNTDTERVRRRRNSIEYRQRVLERESREVLERERETKRGREREKGRELWW